ncbi:ATP-binding protein [Nonomuraea soli]|uniref:Putative ATPase/DNA-binding CsgD family transcriptional regulator n=1 Tax=Nonomuraea soli TaxID=1032476 RepID=A0A7W0CRK8_9ACTN|nr:LuxR C-terminal-related transcriptional regulator [Nonomuraea soli]MBA2896053.1 putative ATPase/DNA-binding CsgD family transcriptional regulator [Nonomuraea soli]
MLAEPAQHAALPAEPNLFVGRESDVAELLQLLRSARVVTLCGSGGIGKTRLALRVAGLTAGAFSGGVRLVELADLEPGREITARLHTALGLRDGQQSEARLIEAIGERRILLLIDNCEPVVAQCASTCAALLAACPNIAILATSREPLRVPGETVWRVPPLSLPRDDEDPRACEAVRLFAARAAAARPDLALTDELMPRVVELCRALDGMPLALELAAAMTRVLSIPQLVSMLGDRFRVLAGGDRTAPPRQRTLRATVDWSYRLLSKQEALLLNRLAIFRNGWTLSLAERVGAGSGLREEEILARLCDLVDKSLVVVDGEAAGEARYRMLETIREYALEQLRAAGGEAEARDRHLAAFAEVAAGFGAMVEPGGAFTWPSIVRVGHLLEAFVADVGAAVEWALSSGAEERATTMVTDLHILVTASGRSFGERSWLERLLEAAGTGLPARPRGRALIMRAEVAIRQGDPATGRNDAGRGLELCRSDGDVHGQALGLVALALATLRPEPLEEALALTRRSGGEVVEMYILGIKALLAYLAGLMHESKRLYTDLLARAAGAGNAWAAGLAHGGLAQVARHEGDVSEARAHYERGLEVMRRLDLRQEVITCLSGLGLVALELGALTEARTRLTEALRLAVDAGSRLTVTRLLGSWARLCAAEGDQRRAVLLASCALALRERQGDARTERVLRPARAALGETLVAVLWSEGRTMTLEEAVECALSGQVPEVAPRALRDTPQDSRLTARELEIAGLITRGLSNRAIAEELVISKATVARHVANILGKLGFTTRTQIASWIAAQR